MIILSTYPRSGSHLLGSHMRVKIKELRYKLMTTHEHIYEDGDYLISILRDPVDVMASKLTMDVHYETDDKTFEWCFREAKKQYLSFFDYITEHASLLIKYDDILNNMDSVLYAIGEKLGVEISSGIVPQTVDKPDVFHLATSKTSPHYEAAYNFVSSQDMSDFYEVYNKALSSNALLVL